MILILNPNIKNLFDRGLQKNNTIGPIQKNDKENFINHSFYVGDWIFYLLLIATVLMAVVASYFFLASGGDPAKVAVSKNMLWWVGGVLILAAIAKTIPTMIKEVIV